MNTETEPGIESRLKKFIVENLLFSGGEYPYPDDASFLAKGVIDSIGIMELIEFVGTEFGVQVPIEDLTPQNFDSVTSVARYIRTQSGAEAPALPGAAAQVEPVAPKA